MDIPSDELDLTVYLSNHSPTGWAFKLSVFRNYKNIAACLLGDESEYIGAFISVK